MKHEFYIISITFLLLLSTLSGCKTKYVTEVQYKERITNKTDTLIKSDSVWVHDSVMVVQRGDTIFHDRWHYRDRYKYIYKNSTDTLVIHDSIPYKVEVEKPPTIGQRITNIVEKGYITIIIMLTLACVIAWLLTRKK